MGAGCSAPPTLKGMLVATAFLEICGAAGCFTGEEMLRKLEYSLFARDDDGALSVALYLVLDAGQYMKTEQGLSFHCA